MKRLIVQSQNNAQQLVDYINACNTVSCYAVSIDKAALPTLVTPPSNYANYAEALATAKLHALSWIDEVVASFTTVPGAFIDFNAIAQQQFGIIQINLKQLQQDPGNSDAGSNITRAINTLRQETTPGLKTLTDLDSWISRYSNGLQPDAVSLNSICSEIAIAEKVDQDAVSKLNAVVNTLQSLVNERNELATLNTVANATFSIFLAVVGVGVGAPFTAGAAIIVGLLVGVSTAAFTSFVPISSDPDYQESLKHIQKEMNNVNTEIGAMNTIVGLLQITANQFGKLVKESGNAGDSIKEVLGFWQNLQNDLSEMVADIENILKDVNNNISEALDNIARAISSWNDLTTYMNNIKGATYNINPAVERPPLQQMVEPAII